MIRIEYVKDGMIHELNIDGHANYAGPGIDIVCAGISALSYALAQTLIDFESSVIKSHVILEEGSTSVKAEALTQHAGYELNIIFEFAMNGYRMIAEQYPENVSIKETIK